MRRILWMCLGLTVAACGVQRPLMKPKDIPAYEQKQREKREKIEQEQRELQAIDAKTAEGVQ